MEAQRIGGKTLQASDANSWQKMGKIQLKGGRKTLPSMLWEKKKGKPTDTKKTEKNFQKNHLKRKAGKSHIPKKSPNHQNIVS